MDTTTLILSALTGYLLGSISFARVVAQRVRPGVNLDQARTLPSETGEADTISGIGAYTTSIALGGKYGGIVALLDMLKAFVPVLVLRLIFPDQPYMLICSIFAVLGHNFPIYYGFKGGRGLSTMLGSLIVIEPLGMFAAMIAGTLLGILLKNPPTAMLIWFPLLTLWSIYIRPDMPKAIYTVVLIVLFIIADIPELKSALRYRREGRLEEYNQMVHDSAPMMRMMNELSDKVRFWDNKEKSRETGE